MARQRQTRIQLRVLAAAAMVALLMSAFGSRVRAQDDAEDLTITLNEYKGSGVSGWATLSSANNGLQVTMAVEGRAVTGNHPSHIHTGTCTNFDPNPTFPLTTVILDPLSDDGESKTSVDEVTLDDLQDDDYVILIHQSAEELTNYFVCGDIKESNTFTDPKTAGSVTAPSTGTGSAVGARPAASMSTGIGVLVVAFAVVSLAFRRRFRLNG